MKDSTRKLLKVACDYCEKHDKSTEFMIQYMQDFAGVSFDCVMNYLNEISKEQ